MKQEQPNDKNDDHLYEAIKKANIEHIQEWLVNHSLQIDSSLLQFALNEFSKIKTRSIIDKEPYVDEIRDRKAIMVLLLKHFVPDLSQQSHLDLLETLLFHSYPYFYPIILDKIDINVIIDEKGNSLLFRALKENKPNLAIVLIERGIDLKHRDNENKTVLHHLTEKPESKGKKVFDKLITDCPEQITAIIDTQDKYGFTPLHCSIRENSKYFIQQLINAGANVFFQTTNGNNAFRVAIYYFHKQKSILEHIHPLLCDGLSQEHLSHASRYMSSVKWLGEIIDAIDSAKLDIILKKSDDEYAFFTMQLIEYAINATRTNSYMRKQSEVETRKLIAISLLEKYLSLGQLSDISDEVFNRVISIGDEGAELKSNDIVKKDNLFSLMLAVDGNPNKIIDEEDNTLLHFAIRHGRTNTVEALLSHGADLVLVNKDGFTVLHMLAKQRTHTATQNRFIRLVSDITSLLECTDKQGRTALLIAAYAGNKDIVEYLLNNGANPKAKDNTGNTALHLAAQGGCCNRAFQRIAEKLLASDTFVDEPNQAGKTILDYAVENNNMGIVEMLKLSLGMDAEQHKKRETFTQSNLLSKSFIASPIYSERQTSTISVIDEVKNIDLTHDNLELVTKLVEKLPPGDKRYLCFEEYSISEPTKYPPFAIFYKFQRKEFGSQNLRVNTKTGTLELDGKDISAQFLKVLQKIVDQGQFTNIKPVSWSEESEAFRLIGGPGF